MAELRSTKVSNRTSKQTSKQVSQKAIRKLLSDDINDEQLAEFKDSNLYNKFAKEVIKRAAAKIPYRNKIAQMSTKDQLSQMSTKDQLSQTTAKDQLSQTTAKDQDLNSKKTVVKLVANKNTKSTKSRWQEAKTELSEKISDNFDPESIEFERDMEEGKYEHWIVKYPEHLQEIFEGLINLGYDELFTYSCIYGFVERGIDINKNGDYRSDCAGTTPLGHACEFRRCLLIRSLLENGANPNLADEHGMTPLDSVIMGHSPDDTIGIVDNASKIKKMILILQEYGVNLVVKNWIMKENFDKNDDYIDMPKDEFFVNFVSDVQRNFDDNENEK
jgi:hypothetical protein